MPYDVWFLDIWKTGEGRNPRNDSRILKSNKCSGTKIR